jgi:isocitrate dehydrogenase kinase/phosphatase
VPAISTRSLRSSRAVRRRRWRSPARPKRSNSLTFTDVRDALPSASRLARDGARAIEESFETYLRDFRAVTRRAEERFVRQEWQASIEDAARRLDVYAQRVDDLAGIMALLLGERVEDELVWAATKAVYSGRIAERGNWELAETFFNSISRKVLSTVGADPDGQFVDTDFDLVPSAARQPVHASYSRHTDLADLIEEILSRHAPPAPFRDLGRDAAAAARRLENILDGPIRGAEVLTAVFYRRKGAYVVGRLEVDGRWTPLVLALLNTPDGMVVDAVLCTPNDVSILFSFTRSHFHVDLEPPHSVVAFLSTLMPEKRLAELYTAIGHSRHGKTALYRNLIGHLTSSRELFDVAPGTPGLVMVTFTTADCDLVFKVIRDRFPPQKRITRGEVLDRYRLVFHHDRAGRLVEAHEFDHLRFDRLRFSDQLLEELLDEAGRTVRLDNGHVVIDHAYIERRVDPLDLYLERATQDAAREVVIDYGATIEELAATGVFPGDLLLKNFGVTRHGRVVSYDYDELRLLDEVRFRKMPVPQTIDEELAAEPWFGVAHEDVFPEEFRTFLGLSGGMRDAFEGSYEHLYTKAFWQGMQNRLADGEIVDIRPYAADCTLATDEAQATAQS